MKLNQLLLVACLAVFNSAFAQKDAKTDPRFAIVFTTATRIL